MQKSHIGKYLIFVKIESNKNVRKKTGFLKYFRPSVLKQTTYVCWLQTRSGRGRKKLRDWVRNYLNLDQEGPVSSFFFCWVNSIVDKRPSFTFPILGRILLPGKKVVINHFIKGKGTEDARSVKGQLTSFHMKAPGNEENLLTCTWRAISAVIWSLWEMCSTQQSM